MKCFTPIRVSNLSVVHSRLGAIAVPFGLEEKNKFQPDINEIAQKISSRTRMIIFNSPNNPTGTVFNNAALEGIAKLAVKHDLWVLSDEIYARICSAANTNPFRCCPAWWIAPSSSMAFPRASR